MYCPHRGALTYWLDFETWLTVVGVADAAAAIRIARAAAAAMAHESQASAA
jgi:hypothetical protein